MSLPKISVVIPAYNCSNYLKDCIESVEAQKHIDFEIIIVEDGSTDNTFDLAKKLQANSSLTKDRFFVYQNDQNLGNGVATSKGFVAAKGDYIARVDADDMLAYNALTEVSHFLDNNPEVDLAWTLYETMQPDGLGLRLGKRCHQNRPKNQKEVIIQNLHHFSTFHMTATRTRSYFEKMAHWNAMPRIATDYAYILQNMFNTQMRRVDHVAYYYRSSVTNSLSSQPEQAQVAATHKQIAITKAIDLGIIDKNNKL